jgi:hypothetical protein
VLADQYAQSAQQNAMLLKQYSWTMRAAVTYNGKSMPPQLYMMRYDANGNLQKTPLTVQQQQSYHGLRGRVKKKKVGEAEKDIESVVEVVKTYSAPTPGTMMDFFSRAQPVTQPDGSVIIAGANFLQKGDNVSFALDPSTHQPKLYNFATQLNGDTLNGQVHFGAVPGGPRYASQVNVTVPAKQLQMQVDNFDYVRQQQ